MRGALIAKANTARSNSEQFGRSVFTSGIIGTPSAQRQSKPDPVSSPRREISDMRQALTQWERGIAFVGRFAGGQKRSAPRAGNFCRAGEVEWRPLVPGAARRKECHRLRGRRELKNERESGACGQCGDLLRSA